MFKDAYINDNERIKPDDEFLEQLKKMVAQEEVQIAGGVDGNNVDNSSLRKNVRVENPSIERMVIWKRAIGIAACFVIICTTIYAVSGGTLLQEYKMVTRLQEAFSGEEMKEDKIEIDLETKQLYDAVYELFQTYNVTVYSIGDQMPSVISVDYLDGLRNSQYEVTADERDDLIGNILNQKYEIVESMEALKNVQCYVAEFENDSFAVFAVEADKYIYIKEVSDVQILTYREFGR